MTWWMYVLLFLAAGTAFEVYSRRQRKRNPHLAIKPQQAAARPAKDEQWALHFVPEKGTAASQPAEATAAPPGQLSCPKCSSTQLSGNRAGFGLGKAAVGGVLLGGLGLLGGFLGAGKVRVTCLQCGHAWEAGKHKA